MFHAVLRLSALLLLVQTPLVAQAQWFGEVTMEGLFTDNLPRAQQSSDKFDDTGLSASAVGDHHWQPGIYTGVIVGASVARRQFVQHSGMSNSELGIASSINHKFGLGDRVSVLTVAADLSRATFNNDIRDAWNRGISITLGKRITDTLSLNASVGHTTSDAEHDIPKPTTGKPGNAWDQRSWNLALYSELELSAVSWLSARYDFRSGDIVSTGLPYGLIAGASKAITLDTVFGPHAVAYRIDARTHGIAVDYNRVMGEAGTVYIGIEQQETRGTSDIDYGVTIIRTGLIYSF